MTDDGGLIRRILHRGDRAAADELIRRHYDEIYRFCLRQSAGSGDPRSEAEDLTQDVFLSALRSLSGYNPKKAGFRTWLFRVAVSRIIDIRRRFHPHETLEDDAGPVDQTDFTVELDNQDLLAAVEEHMRAMPSRVQQALRLHLFARMSFARIAEMTGESEPTVKTRYYRALARIREEFSDDGRITRL